MRVPTVLVLCLSLCFLASSSSRPPPRPAAAKKKSGCFKVNDCKCIMKDGSGVINLNAMGDAAGFLGHLMPVAPGQLTPEDPGHLMVPLDPSHPMAPEDGELLVSFSPCQPFSPLDDLTGDCTNVAACLIVRLDSGLSQCTGFGHHRGNEFHYNDSLKTLSVSYFADSEEQPLTVVHYHCNPNLSTSSIQESVLSAEGPLQLAGPLQLWVESPCACPNGCNMGDLGLGKIFLIFLSISATSYFILGSCALRPFRSSAGGGVLISPEPSVWCMPCYLCTERRPDDRAPRPRHAADAKQVLHTSGSRSAPGGPVGPGALVSH